MIYGPTFATVRNRSKIAKGPGSRSAGLAMAFKLIEASRSRWRAVNAPYRGYWWYRVSAATSRCKPE
jgi:hypothetical protein